MFSPHGYEFDGFYDDWVNKGELDTRYMNIKYLKVLNPKVPNDQKKYERRQYRTQNYMEQFRAWAQVYFDNNFKDQAFESYDAFVNEFEKNMMCLLCNWERKQMDHGIREIQDKKIAESQIINETWIQDER